MKRIRTRYAPSPTGRLHIGGARSALFGYLFAKHNGGDFIVRTEDTDFARNIKGGEDSQLDNLEWLGIKIDESPRNPIERYGKYRQSEKLDRYEYIAKKMLEDGFAYKAYDSIEELTAQKDEQEKNGSPSFRYDKNWLKISDIEMQERDKRGEYSIRVSLPKNVNYEWNDLVRGYTSWNTDDIGDFVIIKQNKYPTYNFAVVVDDHDMEITHVFRGEEHISNTPKQLAIFDMLKWDTPEYGHLTIITNMEGKKLSKRDNETKQFIEDYRKEGYHPHSIFNFLSLLGWTHPSAKEVMSQSEIIDSFDVSRLSKSPSKFDIKKMMWFSKEYIKNLDTEKLISKINFENQNHEWKKIFVDTYKVNSVTYNDLQNALEIYKISDVREIEKNDVVKVFSENMMKNGFTIEGIKKSVSDTAEMTGAKGKNLFMPIRIATTYQQHGPELARAIYLFGEKIIMERLG